MREKVIVILSLLIIFSLFISPPQINAISHTCDFTGTPNGEYYTLSFLHGTIAAYTINYGVRWSRTFFADNGELDIPYDPRQIKGFEIHFDPSVDVDFVEKYGLGSSNLILLDAALNEVASATSNETGYNTLSAQAPTPNVAYARIVTSGQYPLTLNSLTYNVGDASVPEPTTMLLFGSLLIGFVGVGYKKKFLL